MSISASNTAATIRPGERCSKSGEKQQRVKDRATERLVPYSGPIEIKNHRQRDQRHAQNRKLFCRGGESLLFPKKNHKRRDEGQEATSNPRGGAEAKWNFKVRSRSQMLGSKRHNDLFMEHAFHWHSVLCHLDQWPHCSRGNGENDARNQPAAKKSLPLDR